MGRADRSLLLVDLLRQDEAGMIDLGRLTLKQRGLLVLIRGGCSCVEAARLGTCSRAAVVQMIRRMLSR